MIKTLVPTGNEASAGVVRRGVGPQANPFASHIPRYGYGGFQDHEITARILPDLDKDSKAVSPFASLAPYNIADSERPCVGVNRSAGIVLARTKNPDVLPLFNGTYPQPRGGREKNIGLAHTQGMIESINQPILRQPSNFNAQLKTPFKGEGR